MSEAAKQYEDLASAIENMREVMNAAVAGLVADGFSDEQARWAVVGVFTHHLAPKSKDES